jgi:hypothetical protein
LIGDHEKNLAKNWHQAKRASLSATSGQEAHGILIVAVEAVIWKTRINFWG